VDAPHINHQTLFKKSFGALALNCLELYAPQCHNIKNLFTPWILGRDFCLKVLHLKLSEITDYSFNMLSTLGFSSDEIAEANAYVCGNADLADCAELPAKLRRLFTLKDPAENAALFEALKEHTQKINLKTTLPRNVISLSEARERLSRIHSFTFGKAKVEAKIMCSPGGAVRSLTFRCENLNKKNAELWEDFVARVQTALKNKEKLDGILPNPREKTVFSLAKKLIAVLDPGKITSSCAESDMRKESLPKAVGQLALPLSDF
jgi:hypothetical protein